MKNLLLILMLIFSAQTFADTEMWKCNFFGLVTQSDYSNVDEMDKWQSLQQIQSYNRKVEQFQAFYNEEMPNQANYWAKEYGYSLEGEEGIALIVRLSPKHDTEGIAQARADYYRVKKFRIGREEEVGIIDKYEEGRTVFISDEINARSVWKVLGNSFLHYSVPEMPEYCERRRYE